MQQALQRSRLVPSGFVVESASFEGDKIVIAVRASGSAGRCPSCGTSSRRVHSRYRRRVTDLPLSGRIVHLQVIARRFRCDAVLCGRQIFTERFADGVLAPSSRRTARLDSIVHHLGLALGGRPAAGFAKRLMLPVSKDTLLRVVRRRRSRPPTDPLRVIGIDDWAWRRNYRYGSIVCDLERRRVVTLLPDRDPATAQAWLSAHPTIAIIARDRGGGYGEATAKTLPHAVQVADRWHLMENASRAFLDAGANRCARPAVQSVRQSSIQSYSPRPSGCNMTDISAARRPMCLSWPCQNAERQSSRSRVRPAIAGGWSGR